VRHAAGSPFFLIKKAKTMTLGTQTITPNAVQLIASEIPSASIRAFCDGSTLSPPTAPNAFTRPTAVPSAPSIADVATTTAMTLVLRGSSFLRPQIRRDHHTVAIAPTELRINQTRRIPAPSMSRHYHPTQSFLRSFS
jgi:hypothetical protein